MPQQSPKQTTLTKEDLDKSMAGGCATDCGCGHQEPLFFRTRCHPEEQGVDVAYQEGILFIQCRICEKPVVAVKVAEKSPTLDPTPSMN